MEIGVSIPNIGPLATREATFAIIDRTEELGLDALWAADHLAYPLTLRQPHPYSGGRPHEPHTSILDPLAVMSAVAARTQRARIGVSVLILPYRHPLVTAKILASIDVLSGGRVILGAGIGWMSEEFDAVGMPFGQRGHITDEQIRYLREVWSNDSPHFEGKYYRFSDMTFLPKPALPIPIWVGGNTKPAMRRAVRLGDGYQLVQLSMPKLEETIKAFHVICAEAGRPADQLPLSYRGGFQVTVPPSRNGKGASGLGPSPVAAAEGERALTGSLDQVVADLRRMAALGIKHVALSPGNAPDLPAYLAAIDLLAKDIRSAL